MAFKPQSEKNRSSANTNSEPRNYPTPKGGSRKARVSLIVDLGTQKRPDIYKKGDQIVDEDTDGAVLHTQKPCQQVAVFADLVADVVDYGGDIGEAQYRLMLNKSFQGVVQGINFQKVPPKDAKGNTIQGKPWTLHPANILTKLAKATGELDVIESADIEQLLNKPFMATVEVKKTEDKSGKKDADGNVIVYSNVNYRGASEVPLDDDDNPISVAKLSQKARCITFDDATTEDIKFIRGNLIKMIKQAENYEGSAMQKAIEAFEAQKADNADEEEDQEQKPAKPAAKKATPAKPKAAPKFDDMDDDLPF